MAKLKIIHFIPLLALLILSSVVSEGYAQSTGAYNIGIYQSGYSIEDVVAGTNNVYIAQAGATNALEILDLPNPNSPSLVGSGERSSSDQAHCVDINDDESIAVIGASNNVYVFNISTKTDPIRTDVINVGSTVYDIEIFGDLVYCAAYSTGIPVINISDVNNPGLIYDGKYTGYNDNYLQGIYVDPDRDYIYGAAGAKALIFPLNTSKIPQIPVSVDLDYTAWSVEKISNNLLVAGDSHGFIYTIDISNLNSPSRLGSVDLGSILYGLYYDSTLGTKIMAADYSTGLKIADFSSQSNPIFLGRMATTTTGVTGYGTDRMGNYMLLAGGAWGLFVYNVSDCLSIGGGGGFEINGFPILILLGMISIISYVSAKRKMNTKSKDD
ncbi:MAG: hypothetical protein GF317_18380 [Candidatus Lokiarchaeota archaeon]|nr:hypothetical protein [Candidatus Lokiarchaeota archaeon]MBD3201484.1 hypothetical protein [Candidatus Lokiarchaeota archaeon]